MKINKDLVDAVMMLSIIGLVLVVTSDFENEAMKDIFSIALGVVAVIMVGLRFIKPKHSESKEDLAD